MASSTAPTSTSCDGYECSLPNEAKDSSSDGNVEGWNGSEDFDNPLNWPGRKSFGHVIIVSVLSMVININITIIAPGIRRIIQEFQVTSITVGTLAVSIYLLGFALGPLIISPLSEIHGRLPVYHACNGVFFAFVVGCALSQNISQFMIFRFISGFAGAAPLAVGGGTIADCIRVEKRGAAAALFGLGPLLGPVIGPVIGGFLADAGGWRWTLWLVAILHGLASAGTVVFMRETYPPILLARKAARARDKTLNNVQGEIKPDRCPAPKGLVLAACVRPMKMLFFSPIVLILSIYVGLIFGILYLLFATFSTVFEGQYHFTTGTSGLAYLGLGLGELVGLVVFGVLSDKVLQARMARDNQAKPKPEYRLVLMMWFAPVIPLGLFIYGWTAYYKVHWFVPMLGTFIVGFGAFFVILPSQLYLVELFGSEASASAVAANIVFRSLAGAFLPLAGPAMYSKLNYGWGNTLLGFLALTFTPAPFLFYRHGQWLREKIPIQL